jgi:hypothetical protein
MCDTCGRWHVHTLPPELGRRRGRR